MARWTLSRSSALAVLVTVLALPAGVATAQKPASPKTTARRAGDADEAKARALFKSGQTAYDVGEFAPALEHYTEAYKVKALPGFLFNIGQCHRQLGNFKEAAFFFGRFIDNSKPEAPNIELARELMSEMNRRQESAKPSDAPVAQHLAPSPEPLPSPPDLSLPPPPPPLPPAVEPPVYAKSWFWAAIGGAVVVVAAGVTAGVLANAPRVVPYTPTPTTLPDIDTRPR